MNIIITGASRGFGFSIAQQFAAKGDHLFLCSKSEENLSKAKESLNKQFPSVAIKTFAKDLSLKSEVLEFGNELTSHNIDIDVLINNAGSFIPGSVHNEPDGALEKMMEVNLFSAYHLTRALLPAMMKRKSGHIFNMCSIASLKAYNNGGAYSISKFALLGFSKNLREELKPYNIKVTSVLPGAAYTDSWKSSDIDPARIMEADDIAKMIFSASQLSAQACVEEIVLRPQLGDL